MQCRRVSSGTACGQQRTHQLDAGEFMNAPLEPFAENPAEAECLTAARELHAVLKEESDVLKRFDGNELLGVIARKEYLICDLGSKLGLLSQTGALPVSKPLRALLGEIEKTNSENRFFIQKSLTHWQDLLSIFCPSVYGPAGEVPQPGPPSAKGFAFSREI